MIKRVCPTNRDHWMSVGATGDAKFCGTCGAVLIIEGCCVQSKKQGHSFCYVCGTNLRKGE